MKLVDSDHVEVKALWGAGQAQDTVRQRSTDYAALFEWMDTHRVDIAGGSEAGDPRVIGALKEAALQNHYGLHLSAPGEWNAWSLKFGRPLSSGEVPVIPAESGRGGHAGRGIVHTLVRPHMGRIGDVNLVSLHLLSTGHGDAAARAKQNGKLTAATVAFMREAAAGHKWVLTMGDMNLDERHRDAFGDAPVTSAQDAVRRWETTHPHAHGKGPAIDSAYLLDADRRFTFEHLNVLTDAELELNSDHYPIVATIGARLIPT